MQVIYEDNDVLVIDKPAGVNSDDFNGRVHRLDKETSGILIIAKNDKALDFLQKQFKDRKTEKTYIALVAGNLQNRQGKIETLLGRAPSDRRKQKVFLLHEPAAVGKREAITEYKVLERFAEYDLIEVRPKTGRKHQIRAHMAYLGHPIAGDKLYGFKGQSSPEGLRRQFLHASELKIKLPSGQLKTFKSELADSLKICLQKLKTL